MRSCNRPPRGREQCCVILLALGIAALAGTVVGLIGCTNEPFDPNSIINLPPVARIFITTVEGDSLNPTSYYRRKFHWSGSDQDGFVVRYFVSIETQHGIPAPWDTTTATDTTMTFTTDEEGHAEATIRVVCEDDRGALSDTASQYIPLRNFPPVINFQSDFDTLNWSYGAANFRLFAIDLDGNETMADSFLYKLETADTNLVFTYGEPGADPALGWIKQGFEDQETRTFSVDLHNLAPADQCSLTISVTDEAGADTRFLWDWEVREARGSVILVADASPYTDELYFNFMNDTFGVEQWSLYEILYTGLPDRTWVLVETLRQFEAVIWYTGGSSSQNLKGAAAALTQYLQPGTGDDAEPGKLLLISQKITGSETDLPLTFIQQVLGISPTAAPVNYFYVPTDRLALGLQPHLPDLASTSSFAGGTGVQLLTGSEAIYQLEFCRTCYGNRPPFDPYVGFRRPERTVDPLASLIALTLQLEYFDHDQVRASLLNLLAQEMGVTVP